MNCEFCGTSTNTAIQTRGGDIPICDSHDCDIQADNMAADMEAEADDMAQQRAQDDNYQRYY